MVMRELGIEVFGNIKSIIVAVSHLILRLFKNNHKKKS